MATLTHVQCMAAFEHITHTVMEKDNGSPLLKALATSGINNIYGLLSLDQQNIAALHYDHNGTKKFPNCCDQNRVKAFVAYVCHRIRVGTPIRTDYLLVTADNFNEYRRTAYLVDKNHSNTLTENYQVADFLADTRRSSSLFRSPIVCDNEKDTNDTAALTDNPEPPIAQEEIIGEENIEEDDVIGAEFYEIESFKEVQGSKKEETSEQEGTGHGNNKENVPREPEQPDLKKTFTLAVKEHDKTLGRYYNKTYHYKEYKPHVFLAEKLWPPDPPSPAPPPKPPPPEPPPPERTGCKVLIAQSSKGRIGDIVSRMSGSKHKDELAEFYETKGRR